MSWSLACVQEEEDRMSMAVISEALNLATEKFILKCYYLFLLFVFPVGIFSLLLVHVSVTE